MTNLCPELDQRLIKMEKISPQLSIKESRTADVRNNRLRVQTREGEGMDGR